MATKNWMEQLETDDVVLGFGEYDEFEAFLMQMEEYGSWHTMPCTAMMVQAVDSVEADLFSSIGLKDTMENGTGLCLCTPVGTYLLGKTAKNTLLSRMRIAGNGIADLNPDAQADVFNYLLAVAKGNVKLRELGGKIIAAHGGDDKDYCVLSQLDIFQAAFSYLTGTLGASFVGSTYDHYCTEAFFAITDPSVISAYQEILTRHGMHEEGTLKVVIEVLSSDTGWTGANIRYHVVNGGKVTCLTGQRVLNHDKGAKIENFVENLNTVLSGYRESLVKLERLASVRLSYAEDCIYNLAKKVKLPKRMIDDALAGASLMETALEAYLTLSQVYNLASERGVRGRALAELGEKLSSCVLMDWRQYDHKKA